MELREIVDGKRVVVIGASKCIEDNNREHIEGYDVVVRINSGWPVDESLIPKVGNRVDIYYNVNNRKTGNLELNQAKLVLCCAQGIFFEFCKNNHILTTKLGSRMWLFKEEYNFVPTTGFFAIWDLLACDIRELYITGFTFYKEPYHVFRLDGAAFLKNIWDIEKKCIHRHDPEWEFEHICKTYMKDSRIKVDKKLFELILNRNISIL